MHTIYEQLAFHLSALGMGMPYVEELVHILMDNLSQKEAEVLLLFPSKVSPLFSVSPDEIRQKTLIPEDELASILESLTEKGFLFRRKTKTGKVSYTLIQVGFGFPQVFFWANKKTPHARHMANMVAKYFNREITEKAYGSSETKPFRYVPSKGSIDESIQTVFPYHTMENVLENAKVIAVASCACRVVMDLKGKACGHPLEVCMKFDELAEYVIQGGYGREVTKKEAHEIVRISENAGLVHFVDNAVQGIKHNCNCCGCSCWSVGSIRRRKIPRDKIMATYFIRITNLESCSGCGECERICPVEAVRLKVNYPEVDKDICIGCGICVVRCPQNSAKLILRPDKKESSPLPDFVRLHEIILKEKGLVI